MHHNKLTKIDVVILVGGQGTRLREAVSDRPKPMAEINQRPFLDILIDYAAGYGFGRFIICTGYMSDFIENYYANRPAPPQILISREAVPLGTGGAVKNAEGIINSESFLVMNGDSFCPVNLADFVNFHLSRKAMVSMAVIRAGNNTDTGGLFLDDSQRVVRFEEKGKSETAFINAGIYLFKRDVLSLIPPHITYSLEVELFPKLTGREFYGYICGETLIDIGTPERLAQARNLLSGLDMNHKPD